jgi:chromate reductase
MRSANILIFVGSLRKESLNRKLAHALIALNAPDLKFEFAEIGSLPLYNQDIETNQPPFSWLALRKQVQAADAVLFITPEYNRSVPGSLKNAIDVASRPYGQNAFDAKPGAVISVSQGALGAFAANHHLRQSLVFLNVPTMQQPEAYIGHAANLFDASGNLTHASTRDFLPKFLHSFASWIDKNRRP